MFTASGNIYGLIFVFFTGCWFQSVGIIIGWNLRGNSCHQGASGKRCIRISVPADTLGSPSATSLRFPTSRDGLPTLPRPWGFPCPHSERESPRTRTVRLLYGIALQVVSKQRTE
ncbi:polyketide cyclase/dehydrase and lipid transport superfamily protein [Actinidia rufa]|uniref:Polyketide cyclase/dehydrase and lipid transport superfamily protein n=1 Tax=Actinidia rufa TaxID=165716 RepID=A0A7J0GTQ4_9ERIC|nr:polyketide cyclase/dehydrase and lipid transport superfamily protein [Actinidia rufa]